MVELGFSIGGASAHIGYQKPFDRQAEIERLSEEITELSGVAVLMATPAWKLICDWTAVRVSGFEKQVIALARDRNKNENKIAGLMDLRDTLDSFMLSINNRVASLPHKQQELNVLIGASVTPSPSG